MIRTTPARGLNLPEVKREVANGGKAGKDRIGAIDFLASRIAEAVGTEVYNFRLLSKGINENT